MPEGVPGPAPGHQRGPGEEVEPRVGRGEDTVPGVPPSAQAHLRHLEYEGGGGPVCKVEAPCIVSHKQ